VTLAAALAGAGGTIVGTHPPAPTPAPVPVQPAAVAPTAVAPEPVRRADFRGQTASPEVVHIADWSVRAADHKAFPFIIVDKVNARAYAFDRHGSLLESTPVLVGMGVGDRFPREVLDIDMYQTKPSQRVTPAGRYFAEEGLNLDRERVLWVDYDAGIALHKLPKKFTKQRRQERIVSPDPKVHRITYGCINVPPGFYDRVVRDHFRARGGFVYVLPDTLPLNAFFRTDEPASRRVARAQQAAPEQPKTTRHF
jgi:hypothetical protein